MAMISRKEVPTTSMRLVLLVAMFKIELVKGGAVHRDVEELQLQRWRQKLPDVGIPPPIAVGLSPLTQRDLHHFRAVLKANESLNATRFCNVARLSCRPNMPVLRSSITSYGCTSLCNEDDMHLYVDAAELRAGGQMTLPDFHPPVTWKSFLPRELAEIMPPLSAGNVDQILRLLDIPRGCNLSRNMLSTVEACEARLGEGESRTCCTSVECMLDYVASNFGSDVELVSDTSVVGSGQRAKVIKAKKRKKVSGKAPMACHRLVFPYGVLYCHYFNGTDAFDLELEVTQNGRSVTRTASAVCHYFSNKEKEGTGKQPVCHLIYGSTFLWLHGNRHH
uniref:TSA: Wollemia nobilis Ref_Wollemi_Transcript_10115_1577 transcribed RNA sequence n=1 Tax=Wollemia nobilis TaxID=56998 RepID=A0A0C9S701_9CONI